MTSEPGVSSEPAEAERRNAEKVQSALYRIAELAGAAQDLQEFYRELHGVVGELMPASNLYVALYDAERQLINYPYHVDELDDDWPDTTEWVEFGSREARGVTGYVLRTGEPQLITYERHLELVEQGEIEQVGTITKDTSWLGVPLRAEQRTVGLLAVQSYTKDVRYGDKDKELLAFVGQHVGAALSRARAIEETRQRNAELALINSVQEALAGELELQAIYDVVGDKIQEIFDAQGTAIAILDEATGLVSFPYLIERGERLWPEPQPPGSGFTKHVFETGEPLLIHENLAAEVERHGSFVLAGEMPKSMLWVPLITAGRASGVISLDNFDREHAFTDSDRQLLQTLAGSLSVALENARLVHETRQRNAELALINSVQEALAGELELQAIYDLVGDRIQEIFDAQVVDIGIYDETSGLLHFPYTIERGVRYPDAPIELIGFRRHAMETLKPLLIDEDVAGAAERYGNPLLSGEVPKAVLYVPLVAGSKATGVISLQNLDRERAFSESDQQLLETLARSLSVALENARLVHETRQRNAELALINSVQEALAGELDLQAIYDVVGDKIQEIFDAQVVDIGIFDFEAKHTHYPYTFEKGVRFPAESGPLSSAMNRAVFETKAPVLISDVPTWNLGLGDPVSAPVGEPALSILIAPLFSGEELRGRISLQNLDRTNAFSENDVRLLTTLAGSLSVALENARLVHETRQRNAELALINSVQEALAGELEMQAIYDVVGDRIQEIFDAQVVDIGIFDFAAGVTRYVYTVERGVLRRGEEVSIGGSPTTKLLFETKAPVLINDVLAWERERGESIPVPAGESSLAMLVVPLTSGDELRGRISLQNLDRANAFSESDVRLLTTLAGSLSVALENARLVHETRQRNAELALINGVQAAIAGELDPQAIYDLVGDRIQEIFDAQVVDIGIFDFEAEVTHYPYIIEKGVRFFPDEPSLLYSPTNRAMIETRAPVLINDMPAFGAERHEPMDVFVDVGEPPLSLLNAPLVSGDEVRGRISLQNVDRTNAFSESDVRLLTTLAGSLSVALENARLVHETRQRNAELALINGVQAAIAGELDPQSIYALVGDKLQEVFDAQVVSISVYDEASGLLTFPYVIERGERLDEQPMPLIGFRKHVMETREPLMIDETTAEIAERYGNPYVLSGEPVKSALFVPLVVGGRSTGVLSLQNVDRTHAFGADDQRLLTTLAGSLSVALDNARLVHETRQRVAELATVNSVGQALAAQLELDALIELVGERIRETFEADIAYVALHDEAAGQIEFVYYYESGERPPQEPLRYGEGLTSQILQAREPLLLNRQEDYEGKDSLGTPSMSYLGVPIFARDRAIGVISVQSIREEGRFTEPDARLLDTIASNVGGAIQNARLFAEVERQREHFESLVEISPVAVVVMDAEERVTGWNPAAAELFGHTAEEAVGRHIDDLVFGDDVRDEGRDVTREALADGRAHRIARRRRKDGTAVDVELMLVPLTIDEERVGFLGTYHDITELRRARDEAEAATQAKSAFLATMSHEIRTPMNAVIGMTGLLLGTELSAEQREFAEVVRSSGDALLHVIDDILDYSKIEAGKLELEREPVDLRECVEGALDIVAPRAWEKQIELGCLIGEDAPAGIVGDAGRLRQVLLNLLSNAVKFTEEGEVVVEVGAEPRGAGSYRLALAVRDTGIGIPPERIDALFESFSQGDASTTRRYGGTGLGLAISRRLVELMGGTMRVESEVNEGSTFHIELDVDPAEVPARLADPGALPQLAGKRVLVVDDNATNREIVARHVRSWSMEPVAVATPAEALALLERGERFDLAVLDMLMPEMDGLALAGEIRHLRDQRELPLVLLTSLGRLPGSQSAGPFAVQLAKPVKASQLYNALLKALAPQVETQAAESSQADEKLATSTLRILLAEDNAVNQKVALRLLEQLGYRADVAWNGREALEALERRPYDVVLMDVQMPELDGLDASRRICARWPAEERPRIVAMTANALPEDREACFAAGMDDYVAKPIRPEELAEALGRAHRIDGTGSANGGVALDGAAVASLKDLGGDEFVVEVIDTFLGEAPALVAALRTAQESGDMELLRRAAHTLKSNGQTFGAGEFSELCRELEQRAKNGEPEGAAGLVERIEDEYRALEQALAALRPEPAR